MEVALSPLAQLVWGGVAMLALMFALWLVQRRTKDAGVVDAGWTGGLGLLAIFYAATMETGSPRAAAAALLAVCWSARLTAYIVFHRLVGKSEDARYRSLRDRLGSRADQFFLAFFVAQGAVALAFSLSFWTSVHHEARPFGFLDWTALAIGFGAVTGEAIADRQLTRFRTDAANRGRTCRAGLWRYSRHPNYFFEWLHWCAYPFLAWGAPLWPLTLLSPAAMLVFLFKVTGIPAAEAQAVRSRGDDYREYQKTTSVFWPWFPRRPRT